MKTLWTVLCLPQAWEKQKVVEPQFSCRRFVLNTKYILTAFQVEVQKLSPSSDVRAMGKLHGNHLSDRVKYKYVPET